jgi:quaternary ammonium compound-resistance protein SugE
VDDPASVKSLGTAPFFKGVSMSWFLLFIAGLLEVAWAAGLKTSEGFTRLWPSVFTIVTSTGSFVLLAFAMKELPLGTAYAVWTGIGAVGAFIFGIVMMGEAVTVARIASVSLIVIGMVGLKLSSGH